MKIYVISENSSCGSCYILAVTTSLENAESLKRNYSVDIKKDKLKIIEFEDYSNLTPIKGYLYKVFVDCDSSGNIMFSDADLEYYIEDEPICKRILCKEHLPKEIKRIDFDSYVEYVLFVVSESEEQACVLGEKIIEQHNKNNDKLFL